MKPQPGRDITSYDLLKSLAVMGMIVDHFGFYLFPDQPWIQAVARIVGPTWFFLVGYSNSRTLPWQMFAATAILAAASLTIGIGVFPLSALLSLMIVRMAIDPLARRMLRSWASFGGYAFLLVLLILPSAAFFEYGTLVLLLGMTGYLARHRVTVGGARRTNTTLLCCWLVTCVFGTAMQEVALQLPLYLFLVMAVGQSVTLALLCRFRPVTYPELTRCLPRPAAALLRFGGRHTLEIYVVHLLLFKAIACVLEPERFPFLRLELFYHP